MDHNYSWSTKLFAQKPCPVVTCIWCYWHNHRFVVTWGDIFRWYNIYKTISLVNPISALSCVACRCSLWQEILCNNRIWLDHHDTPGPIGIHLSSNPLIIGTHVNSYNLQIKLHEQCIDPQLTTCWLNFNNNLKSFNISQNLLHHSLLQFKMVYVQQLYVHLASTIEIQS